MRIAVCDDEKSTLEEVRGYINDMARQMNIVAQIHLFQNTRDLEYEIENGLQYDIVFLDIKIGDQNGIDIANKMKEKYPTTMIAFMTGHYQYVYDVFDAQPCGFIKKPIEKEKIEHVFKKAVKLCDNMPAFSYSSHGKRNRIYLNDIYYIISDKRKIILKTRDGDKIYYEKMNEVEKKLQEMSSNFIRIGQSMIINARYIKEIDYQTVIVSMDGKKSEQFNISQKYRGQVKKWCLESWIQ